MNRLLARGQHLVFRGLKHRLPSIHLDFAADGQAAVGLQGARQVSLAKPYYFNVAGVVAKHCLGGLKPPFLAQRHLPGLPELSDHRAVLFRLQLGYLDYIGVIQMPSRKEIKQIPHRGYFQALEPGRKLGIDTPQAVDGCIHGNAGWRSLVG